MQIKVSVVCDTSQNKGSLYKQIKSSLVGEHAILWTGFVCKTVHVTTVIKNASSFASVPIYLPKHDRISRRNCTSSHTSSHAATDCNLLLR